MRVSDNMNYNQVGKNISKNRAEGLNFQNQSATQKRVNKPSDDPVSSVKALATRTELSGTEQFIRNINSAKTFLDYSEQTLGEITDYLSRAKELAIQQSSSGGATPGTRLAVAGEVEQISKQLIQIGNRKLGDRFVFGGYKTLEAPFKPNGEFRGDAGQMMVEIGNGSFVSMNLPGNFIFSGDPINFRSTTDEIGEVALTAESLQKVQADQPDEMQPTRDSRPQGAQPENTFQSQSNVAVRGPASVNEDQELNEKELVNSNLPKGENVFGVLKDLEISLRTNDTSGVQGSLDRLDRCIDQVVTARSHLGTRQMSLQTQFESLQRFKVDGKATLSQLEDIDVYQLYNDLSKNENTLKATINSGSKLAQLSLLDFLR